MDKGYESMTCRSAEIVKPKSLLGGRGCEPEELLEGEGLESEALL